MIARKIFSACQVLNSFCTSRPHLFHRLPFTHRATACDEEYNRPVTLARHVPRFLLLVCLVWLAAARVDAAEGATFFRLFLTDGTSVVSYGEFARLDDRVIFSMPVGGPRDQPRLHVVTLAASLIDWVRTEQYSASARARWYADTRGEDDFQLLSAEVARILNEVALLPDRQRGLEIAENARRVLGDWPRTHFGYRQAEVREIVALLDESISGLRASLGMTSFDLAFVATAVDDAPHVALLDDPGTAEQLEQVLHVAALTERAADRVALLQAALLLLDESGTNLPRDDVRRWKAEVDGRIRRELALDEAYASLSKRLVATTTRAAAEANVPGVEKALGDLRQQDERLGRSRPETVDALRASIQSQLDAARALRLRRDRWLVRRDLYAAYQKSVGGELRQLSRMQQALEAIRKLEGPTPSTLNSLRGVLQGGATRLERVSAGVPQDVRDSHEMLVNAWRFAERAVNARSAAVSSGNLAVAWEASSAAAGALLMLERAQRDIGALMELPRLQ